MTSATATRGGNPPDPILREGRHFTENPTAPWNSFDQGQPRFGAFWGAFLPEQEHLPSDSSTETPMPAGAPVIVRESLREGGNSPVPILMEGRHLTENPTASWISFDRGQPHGGAFWGAFLPEQDHLASAISGENPILAGAPVIVRESFRDNIGPRTRLGNAASENATDSFVWGPLTPWHTAWSVPPLIGESPYSLAFGIIPSDIQARLDEFRALEDGWYDGYGSAPSTQGLDWLGQQAARNLGGAPAPYIYPTPEGGVQFEWDIGSFRPSLEIDLETRVGEWHCLDLDADEADERELQLERLQDWQWLAEQLLLLQGGAT